MSYNLKSLTNLDKGHRWQPGESGNPGGRPRDDNSEAGKGRRFRGLKAAAMLWEQYEGTDDEMRAILDGLFSLGTKEHYLPATVWMLNIAFGKPR